jgi:RNA polymerase sigma-70 factor (ECF subfamily)
LGKTTKQIHNDLIRRCRENDREAQFELYKIFYKPMYNTSLRILNNTAEAEDIMQESFLDAFRKIDDYTGEGNFGGWLRRIVVNNSLDALKKRKPELFIEGQENLPDEPQETNSETAQYRVEEIKKAMLLLPEDDRVILSLLLFEGYDHEETALILQISYGASRTRYSRARKKLLEILTDQRKINIIHPN